MKLIDFFLRNGESASHTSISRMELANLRGQVEAIGKSLGVIEFDLSGNVLGANANFLSVLGYELNEIQGKHHSLFVDPEYRQTQNYKNFWLRLGRGEFDAGTYRRIGKNGKEIWIQATYNPIFDLNGRPYKVIKYATDITKESLRNADYAGQLAAISKSQAVIEFALDGTILDANDNFLSVMGYGLDEVKGKHHRIFVDTAYQNTNEYRSLWERLGRGEYDAGQYKRIAKDGREVWIQASYNPIMDANNRPFKVVKYATDITEQLNSANAMKLAVDQVRQVVKDATEGDLRSRIDVTGKTGLLATMCEGVNAIIASMHDIVSEIKSATEEITQGTKEIATGNSELSTRTEQQAANLEEAASSMEELTSTVKLNADNAKQANTLAEHASSVAINGGDLIQQVVSTMNSINESSQKIADIIGVIDGIAFQTNILALNAAVEAARAGDQGRGFAVVAAEVRTLAQRSANAAKDIKGLISDSVKKIESGNLLVSKSGDTMKNVVSSIKQVNDIMSEIAAASAEQSSGIAEVSTAVSHMDEMTQQNAALVEEAAAAAESLQTQANQLSQRVAMFLLDERINTSAYISSRPTESRVIPKPTLMGSSVNTRKLAPSAPQEDEWDSF